MFEFIKKIFREWRSQIYDTFIESMTSRWYREVLRLCPSEVSVLDVGIGTGSSLYANRDYIASKKLKVTGVEYVSEYAEFASRKFETSSVDKLVRIVESDFFKYNKDGREKYDVIYFSGSFMILPQPEKALLHCKRMLRSPVPKLPDNGNIYFSQTFEKRTLVGIYVTPLVKYLLHLLTTIDFGKVTYEDDFRKVLTLADVDIVKKLIIHESTFRSQVIIVARPKLTPLK